MTRLVVCFSYACKCQLRGVSLSGDSETSESARLMNSGLPAYAELNHMRFNPAWEPSLILGMLRNLLSQAMIKEYDEGGVLFIPKSNKIHEKLFSPMDKTITELGKASSQNITIRSAGMPPSYDAIHHVFFWIFFLVAPTAWAPKLGWWSAGVSFLLATMTLLLTDLGTCLIDPFDNDATDLPLEGYCKTLEAQVAEIRRCHASGDMDSLTTEAQAGSPVWEVTALTTEFLH